MIVATASQVKNAFGKYLDLVLSNQEIKIVRYDRVIAKMVPVQECEKILSEEEKRVIQDA